MRFAPAELRRFVAAALSALAVPPADAAVVAEALVHADLFGHAAVGVARLCDHRAYVPGLRSGWVRSRPELRVVHETPVSALLDAGGAMGPVGCQRAVDLCLAKATAVGMGAVAVYGNGPAGLMAHWVLQAAERGLVGLGCGNLAPLLAPPGGRGRMLGSNPIALAAPAERDHPFLFDADLAAVAVERIEAARDSGQRVPPHWFVDRLGQASIFPAEFWEGGALLPLGGRLETGGHKGYGLAAMVEVLSGVLSGAGPSWRQPLQQAGHGQFFLAVRPDLFQPAPVFHAGVDQLLADLRAAPTAPGVAQVLAPGDREFAAAAENAARGIALPATVSEALRTLAVETGLAGITPA